MKETDEIYQALLAKEEDLETKVKQLKDAESELNKVKAAIMALSPAIPTMSMSNGKLVTVIYNATGTWKEKIKFAVKSKGHAGTKIIAEIICKMEPGLIPEKVYSAVAVNVGDMIKAGSLKSKKVNGKNEYFINESHSIKNPSN